MSFVTPITPLVEYDLSELELVEEIQTRIVETSQGLLDDFSPASPLTALTEGQAYGLALLADNLNTLPEEFLLKFFNILGLTKSTAKTAVVFLEFTRSSGFTAPVVIPQGFTVFNPEGITFTLDERVIISGEQEVGFGFATAEGRGAGFNLPANSLTGFSLGIPGLASVNNPSPAYGGQDEETTRQALSRGLSFLQFRHLISPRDYEAAVTAIIGNDFSVKAYSYYDVQDYLFENQRTLTTPGLNPINDFTDDISRRFVYIVTSNTDGSGGITEPLKNRVRNFLYPRLQSGTEVIFIEPEISLINISINPADTEPQALYNRAARLLRRNQTLLNRSIGRNVSLQSLYSLVENLFAVDSLSFDYIDERGEVVYSVSEERANILAPTPATVYQLRNIIINSPDNLIYTY